MAQRSVTKFNDYGHGAWILHPRRYDHTNELYWYREKVSACIEALLLSIFKNEFNFHRSNTTAGLLMSTYSALLFFLSATLSGLIIANKFGESHVWVSWNKDIRWSHGLKSSRIWLTLHCKCSGFTIHTSSHPHYRFGLPDCRNHIRDHTGSLVRLAAGFSLGQGHTFDHHGVWRVSLGVPHTSSITRLTGWLVST